MLTFISTADPDITKADADQDFVRAFNDAVQVIACQPLPDSIPQEPVPEWAHGVPRLKISASQNGQYLLVSHELIREAGALESYLCSDAAMRVGRVMQAAKIKGPVNAVSVYRTEMQEIVGIKLIATIALPKAV